VLETTSADTPLDALAEDFLRHLQTERNASNYTLRNYRQALLEFHRWFNLERQGPPAWTHLERDDFRGYLRFLGRNQLSKAAVRLRFSALRSFYRFLMRRGTLLASPIKNIMLPKVEKRLPQFLTLPQMLDLLNAPLQELLLLRQANPDRPMSVAPFLHDLLRR
jgi:site-specific recombinase XerD